MIQKNKYGQYFTPKFMADFMVSLLSCNKDGSILEPSAGAGVFISALEDAGYSHWTAYEIDSSVIRYERTINESFVSAIIQRKYDAVIGNPPYIRWKNLEENLKQELSESPLWINNFNALCDYLFFFIARSIELLKTGGELVFICSDYWINSTNGEALREFILKNGTIDSIYHFKESRVFSGVTSSLMVFKFIKGKEAGVCRLHTYIGGRTVDAERIVDSSNYEVLDIPSFKVGDRWILATAEKQLTIKKLEQSCSFTRQGLFSEKIVDRVGDFFHIGNGLVSGLDKAFNLTLHQDHLSPSEVEKTIKVVKAKDIIPYQFKVISTYAYIEDKELTEDELREKYPIIYAAISASKAELQQRYQYGRSIDFWSFTFPRNKKMFDLALPRILVPCKDRISKRRCFRFCLAPSDVYPLQDVTGLLPKDNCLESIEYVVAYLNSPQVYDWLILNGIVKGEVVEFSEAPIASIPYRRINWDDISEVELHNQITRMVQNGLNGRASLSIEKINSLINKLI